MTTEHSSKEQIDYWRKRACELVEFNKDRRNAHKPSKQLMMEPEEFLQILSGMRAQSEPSDVQKVLRECNEYLSRSDMEAICSNSILHQKIKCAISRIDFYTGQSLETKTGRSFPIHKAGCHAVVGPCTCGAAKNK